MNWPLIYFFLNVHFTFFSICNLHLGSDDEKSRVGVGLYFLNFEFDDYFLTVLFGEWSYGFLIWWGLLARLLLPPMPPSQISVTKMWLSLSLSHVERHKYYYSYQNLRCENSKMGHIFGSGISYSSHKAKKIMKFIIFTK